MVVTTVNTITDSISICLSTSVRSWGVHDTFQCKGYVLQPSAWSLLTCHHDDEGEEMRCGDVTANFENQAW